MFTVLCRPAPCPTPAGAFSRAGWLGMLASSRPIHHSPDVSHAERESKYELLVLFAFVDVALIIFSEARNILEGKEEFYLSRNICEGKEEQAQ